jgi:hypothetical protein
MEDNMKIILNRIIGVLRYIEEGFRNLKPLEQSIT